MQNGEDSPIFSQGAQDDSQQIDVIWDWSSPRSKPHTTPHTCKLTTRKPQNSPKLTIKKHPSQNQIEIFNKLKEEFKTLTSYTNIDSIEQNKESRCSLDDIFDDSMEEQLVICSQKAEQNLLTNGNLYNNPVVCSNSNFKLNKALFRDDLDKCSNLNKESIVTNNTNTYSSNSCSNKIADDSFDFILESLEDDKLMVNSASTNCDRKTIVANLVDATKQINGNSIKQESAQESKGKRKETSVKFETEKKQTFDGGDSPIKCSPEEIEQKRLQAIAKLEAKRKLDVIEKNRREALKRLEMNNKKRALQTNRFRK